MTGQEAFDRVWQWFVVDKNNPSIDPGTRMCVYRGPDGTRCALGVLLPDDLYSPHLEGLNARTMFSGFFLNEDESDTIAVAVKPVTAWLNTELADNDRLVVALQKAHDMAANNGLSPTPPLEVFHRELEMRLRDLALSYRLQVPQ